MTSRMTNAYSVSLDLRMRLANSAIQSNFPSLVDPIPGEDIFQLKKFFAKPKYLTRLEEYKEKNAENVKTLKIMQWFEESKELDLLPIEFEALSPKAKELLSANSIFKLGVCCLGGSGSVLNLINIFEVNNLKRNLNQHLFDLHKNLDGSQYGFHGSGLQNWHSILHNGLAACLNKRSAYGRGSYLSTYLSTSIAFSTCYFPGVFQGTQLPPKFLCLAICEAINYKDVDKHNSYLVVPNDDMVRLEYLLVFQEQS